MLNLRRTSERINHLEFDSDDHGRQIFIQLLQHDQLLQSQIKEPANTQFNPQLKNVSTTLDGK